MIAGFCDASGEELDRSDEEPCGCGRDGLFEVLGEAAVAIEPCQGSFDDPSAKQDFEALCDIGSLDDFDGPLADLGQRILELVTSITTVGEEMAQPGEAVDDLRQHQRRAVAVLDVSGEDQGMAC